MRTLIRSLSLSIAVTLAVLAGGARLAGAQTGARAPRRSGGPGLGVDLPLTDQFLTQPTGWLSFVYDTGSLHFDIMGQFFDVENAETVIGVGGRLYYTVHRSSYADFSLGGGLFVIHTSDDTVDDSFNDIGLEFGPKIRFFITPAVALHSTFGLAVFLADENKTDEFGLIGRLGGTFGLTYFFR